MNDFSTRASVGMAVILTLLTTAGWGQPRPPTPRQKPARPPSGPSVRRPSAKPDPLAQRLCHALHALPAERKSQCCGANPTSLEGVCAQELSASFRSGAVTLDATQIDRCTAETSRQLAGCEWVGPLMPQLPDACRDVVHGQLKAGARCRSSLECPHGLFCKGVGPNREGVCAAPGLARASCEVPSDNLAAFTSVKDDPGHPVCDGLCIKGQCVPFSPMGGACQSSSQCPPGLNCISGRCQDRPLPKIGESCTGNTRCEAGAYCGADRCETLKNAGEPCALPLECRAFECVKAPGAQAGTCGDPCGPLSTSPAKPAAPPRLAERVRGPRGASLLQTRARSAQVVTGT